MLPRMREFRIGEAAQLLGVSPDTVRRLADDGTLTTRRTAGGHRVVDGVSLARALATQAVGADAGAIVARSARNRFTGIVTRVVKDTVAAQVEIQAGGHRLVSLMTAEAVDDLGLEPGMLAVAAVKATNVVVEVPGP
jgi:molybdopterin-binding protein